MTPSVCLSQPRQNWCVQSKDMVTVKRKGELEGRISKMGVAIEDISSNLFCLILC